MLLSEGWPQETAARVLQPPTVLTSHAHARADIEAPELCWRGPVEMIHAASGSAPGARPARRRAGREPDRPSQRRTRRRTLTLALDLVPRLALLAVRLHALLLEERVDVGITAVGGRAVAGDDLRQPRGRVAIEGARADAHALGFFELISAK
jgi:hypothetical protein